MLEKLAEGLWTAEHDFKMGPIPLGTRSTLIRLGDGSLWLHSPGPMDEAFVAEISAQGGVGHIVAPNLFHHLYLREAAAAFPDAAVHLAPGLEAKLGGAVTGIELGDEAPKAWSSDLDQVWVRGMPRVEEVAFLHRAIRTLLLTDLAFHVRNRDSVLARFFFTLTGVYGRFAASRLLKTLIRDKPAFRQSIDRILEWDFDRILVTHGEVLETGGAKALRKAWARFG